MAVKKWKFSGGNYELTFTYISFSAVLFEAYFEKTDKLRIISPYEKFVTIRFNSLSRLKLIGTIWVILTSFVESQHGIFP